VRELTAVEQESKRRSARRREIDLSHGEYVAAERLTNLKATAAMRHEDLRIARKHRNEAEDRWAADASNANYEAAVAAQQWADDCHAEYLAALDAWNAAAEGRS
jgi:hypothetical protein